jgi:hypothetical protein
MVEGKWLWLLEWLLWADYDLTALHRPHIIELCRCRIDRDSSQVCLHRHGLNGPIICHPCSCSRIRRSGRHHDDYQLCLRKIAGTTHIPCEVIYPTPLQIYQAWTELTMLCTTQLPLRTAVALGTCARLSPTTSRLVSSSGIAANYSTSTNTQKSTRQRPAAFPQRQWTCLHKVPRASPSNNALPSSQTHIFKRTFATSTTRTSPASTTADAAVSTPLQQSSSDVPATLPWNDFLALRRTRRRFQLVSSIFTALGSTVAGVSALMQLDIDAVGAQFTGLDPFIVMGLATFASAAAGWLIGPFFGAAAFRVVNRRRVGEMAVVSTHALLCLVLWLCGRRAVTLV